LGVGNHDSTVGETKTGVLGAKKGEMKTRSDLPSNQKGTNLGKKKKVGMKPSRCSRGSWGKHVKHEKRGGMGVDLKPKDLFRKHSPKKELQEKKGTTGGGREKKRL